MNPQQNSQTSSASSFKQILKRDKYWILGVVISFLLVILGVIFVAEAKERGGFSLDTFTDVSEIIPGPVVDDMIKGYWSSRGVSNAIKELDDVEEMKEIGINTIFDISNIT